MRMFSRFLPHNKQPVTQNKQPVVNNKQVPTESSTLYKGLKFLSPLMRRGESGSLTKIDGN